MSPPSNHIKSVALVGATGQQGKSILEALIKHQDQWAIHVLTRTGSATKLPSPTITHEVDYDSHDGLVSALKGVDVLIITLAREAPPSVSLNLIKASAKAGVRYIVPNEWSATAGDTELEKDLGIYDRFQPIRTAIEEAGLSWIALANGFWYSFSLGWGPTTFGFDFKKRELELLDDGKTKICVTTWEQVARAVVAVLSLPLEPGSSASELSISHWRNKHVLVKSFVLSQLDMLESVKRVTNTTDQDWKITSRPSKERREAGIEQMKAGNEMGFVLSLYSRILYPNGEGDFSDRADNERLGLPTEELDPATEYGIEKFMKGE